MKLVQTLLLSLISGLVVWSAGFLLVFPSVTIAKSAPPFTKTQPDGQNPKPNCNCRANGENFQVGDITCIETANGLKRARCQMEQNNTSWEFLSNSCEIAINVRKKSALQLSFIQPGAFTSCTM